MIECNKLDSFDLVEIEELRYDYINSLVAPMDGMWESAIIENSTFWKIEYEKEKVGYFCVDSEMCLLQFQLLDEYQLRAQTIFRSILLSFKIKTAISSTIEPFYLSLCLDVSSELTVNSYLFNDKYKIKPSISTFNETVFRQASSQDINEIECFYKENTEGSGEWIRGFVEKLIKQKQLFILCNNQNILGTGECIISQKQKPYADVGIVVSKEYRRKGVGTYILTLLKEHCYDLGYKPICSCTLENIGSKKTIEKAGFISLHRILNIHLNQIDS